MKPTWSNPKGLVSKRPIALRLMQDELAGAETAAVEFGISKSHLARAAFLKGLPQLSANDFSLSAALSPHPHRRASDFTGGDASAIPAGLSSQTE